MSTLLIKLTYRCKKRWALCVECPNAADTDDIEIDRMCDFVTCYFMKYLLTSRKYN